MSAVKWVFNIHKWNLWKHIFDIFASIDWLHLNIFSVLRSQSKLVQKSRIRIRHCFVAIEPNLHAICLNWLQRTQPLSPAAPAAPAVQNEAGPSSNQGGASNNQGGVSDNHGGASNENPRTGRRMSIASCRNLFEVDGHVEETGFDFLNRVSTEPSTSSVIRINRGDLVDNREKDNDLLDGALFYDSDNSSESCTENEPGKRYYFVKI